MKKASVPLTKGAAGSSQAYVMQPPYAYSPPHPNKFGARVPFLPYEPKVSGNNVKDCFSHPHTCVASRIGFPQQGSLASENFNDFMGVWNSVIDRRV